MCREVTELLFGRVGLRVQFVVVFVIKLSRDGFINTGDHRVGPERRIIILGSETSDLSRAGDNARSANRIGTTVWTYDVTPTPRGSQETRSNAPPVPTLSDWASPGRPWTPEPPGPPMKMVC